MPVMIGSVLIWHHGYCLPLRMPTRWLEHSRCSGRSVSRISPLLSLITSILFRFPFSQCCAVLSIFFMFIFAVKIVACLQNPKLGVFRHVDPPPRILDVFHQKIYDTSESILRKWLARVTFASATWHTWKLKQESFKLKWWMIGDGQFLIILFLCDVCVTLYKYFYDFSRSINIENLFVWPPPHTWPLHVVYQQCHVLLTSQSQLTVWEWKLLGIELGSTCESWLLKENFQVCRRLKTLATYRAET